MIIKSGSMVTGNT